MRKTRRVLPVVLLMVAAGIGAACQYMTPTGNAAVQSASGGAAELDQSVWQAYWSNNSQRPFRSLADMNRPAQLPRGNRQFRVQIGVQYKQVQKNYGKFIQIAAGKDHTCAINDAGAAYCWGGYRYLGIQDSQLSVDRPIPVDTSGALKGKKLVQITAGSSHTCALDDAGAAYCWGVQRYGQLGNGSTTTSSTPVPVDTTGVLQGKRLVKISAGHNHTCALDDAGAAYCWGRQTNGRLGNGSNLVDAQPPALLPVAVDTNGVLRGKRLVRITAAAVIGSGLSDAAHTCALDDAGAAYCWGVNGSGQLGDFYSTLSRPGRVNTERALQDKKVIQISAGSSHTCALDDAGAAYCWGGGSEGQLGNSRKPNSFRVPLEVEGIPDGKKFVRITAGYKYTCALDDAGAAYCWGSGAEGQLGNGATDNALTPSLVAADGVLKDKKLVQISAGSSHTCALDDAGAAYCWGAAGHVAYQIGAGRIIMPTTPVAVSPWAIDYIAADSLKLRAQYAEKGQAATCSAVPAASWQEITASSGLAYDDKGLPHGTQARGNNYSGIPADEHSWQSIVRDVSFTNIHAILSGKTAVWDFFLVDRSLKPDTHYCMRIVTDAATAPGTAIDTYSQYPEIITAPSEFDIGFVNQHGAPLENPVTRFSEATMHTDSFRETTAQLPDIKVVTGRSNAGWNISLAPMSGALKWQRADRKAQYRFNGATPQEGQLTATAQQANWRAIGTSPKTGRACTTTGLLGGGGTFVRGTANERVLMLASAASTVDTNCSFILRDVLLTQTIPRRQAPGTYTLPIAITITAQ